MEHRSIGLPFHQNTLYSFPRERAARPVAPTRVSILSPLPLRVGSAHKQTHPSMTIFEFGSTISENSAAVVGWAKADCSDAVPTIGGHRRPSAAVLIVEERRREARLSAPFARRGFSPAYGLVRATITGLYHKCENRHPLFGVMR